MTIYQIHEYVGEYESFRDYIVGSYMNKDKAMARMEELQRIESEKRAKSEKCRCCPINDSDVFGDTFEVAVERCSMYCSAAKITNDPGIDYECENYYFYWDYADYEIKEVEVIE